MWIYFRGISSNQFSVGYGTGASEREEKKRGCRNGWMEGRSEGRNTRKPLAGFQGNDECLTERRGVL